MLQRLLGIRFGITPRALCHPTSQQAYRSEEDHETASALYHLVELELGAGYIALLALLVWGLEQLGLQPLPRKPGAGVLL